MTHQLLPTVKCALLLYLLVLGIASNAQTTRSQYQMKFSFTNGGMQKDTILTRLSFKFWSKADAYPEYVKWKNLPFCVLKSSINGVGLFSDSSSSFAAGDTIGWLYYKNSSTGHFDRDYYLTNIGSFINDANNPNMQVIATTQGLLLKATQSISPHTELTYSYQALINMFPGDVSAAQVIKYW